MRLRPLELADLPVVMTWSRDRDFCRAIDWRADLSAVHVARWLAQAVSREIFDLVRFGVECEGELVGYVDLANVNENSAEFGIAIGDSNRWGRGLGAAAGQAILGHAFDRLGLRHLNAVVAESNARSRRLVMGLGFRPFPGDSSPQNLNTSTEWLHFRVTGDEWRISTARIVPMTVTLAQQVATWRYCGPWSIYDLESSQPLIDDIDNYYAVIAGRRLLGFCCSGAAARVGSMDADPAVLDVGIGMDPGLVGRGLGLMLGRIVLRHMINTYPGYETLRACVQSWNERSLNLTRRLGFMDIGEISVVQDQRAVSYRALCIRQHSLADAEPTGSPTSYEHGAGTRHAPEGKQRSLRVVPTTVDDDGVIELLAMAVGEDIQRIGQAVQRYRDDPTIHLLIALVDQDPVGVVGYTVDHTKVVVLHIATKKGARRAGVGSQMLAAVRAATSPLLPLTAETDADGLSFYLANGFTAESLGEKYPGVERFHLVLPSG